MNRVMLSMVFLAGVLASSQTKTLRKCFSEDELNARKCFSEDELEARRVQYERTYWDKTSFSSIPAWPQDALSCAQAAREMSGDVKDRSLSPWRHAPDQDDSRIPPVISFAKCLCQGCIIGQSEELAYNSVPVFSRVMVLKKSPCPSDPRKLVLNQYFIQVPVACTCVVPKFAK